MSRPLYRLHFACSECHHEWSIVTPHSHETDNCGKCYGRGEYQRTERAPFAEPAPSFYDEYDAMVRNGMNMLRNHTCN